MNEQVECSICYGIMENAIILIPSGQSYCLKCIQKSLIVHPNLDPLSGIRYKRVKLIPNYALRNIISNMSENTKNCSENYINNDENKVSELEFQNPPGKYTGYLNSLGQRHGKGEFFFENGDSYVGDWAFDNISGKGICKWSNGDIYNGSWVDNQIHGLGSFKYIDGSIYEGSWIKDQKQGFGKLTYPSNEIYEGNFSYDVRWGKGVMIYNNGDKYEGSFKYDCPNGNGVLRISNGDSYVGGFKQGNFHGKGTYNINYNNENSIIRFEGNWINGKKQGLGYEIQKNLTKFQLYYEDDILISKELIIFRGNPITEDDNSLSLPKEHIDSSCCVIS